MIQGFERTVTNAARKIRCATPCGCNSFSADTKVVTDKGSINIAAVVVGTKVLAYNEKTGKNEYQPVLEVFKNQDPEITYLGIKDEDNTAFSDIPTSVEQLLPTGALVASRNQKATNELITTTPGHPFYLVKNVDNSSRPRPQGHEDLKEPWVGAGDLKLGDKVRQSDGTTGTVAFTKTVQEARTMYNLDVAAADTFYVGEGEWLVHNTDNPYAAIIRNLPDDPNELVKQGWKDVSHPEQAKRGFIELQDPISGLRVRYDTPTPGGSGWSSKPHYHVYNPNATGKGDLYLDSDGNPTPKNSHASHIPPNLCGQK